ncbi:MAG: hypothetical protein EKK37_10385 [Sphingobacteriales bacterium]|nr:MAG: hypothetical protein EKK37_10385 [Sphingobacteriales bacterium]
MLHSINRLFIFFLSILILNSSTISAQNGLKLKYKNSVVYSGIEVGSKGVKISLLELGQDAKKSGAFNILKDSSINTDFISFTASSFENTLKALTDFYNYAATNFKIPKERIFTVVSSGVKIQAEKEHRMNEVNQLIDSFKVRIGNPARAVPVIDVQQEAILSHLGIVPDSRRYSTFLIDIGSGNSKGGYFFNTNTKDFKLFQLSWGSKSTANATEKRCEEDKSLANYYKQLNRTLAGAEQSEIIYRVNESGGYPMSDYIAFSGGISWAIATLISPELVNNSVVPVTYDDIVKFSERIYRNYSTLSDASITAAITDKSVDKTVVAREVKRVNGVFDQRTLMAGTGLLLKVMRQFEGIYEKKEFYLVKNGQVGWISAYVDESIKNSSVSK